MNVGSGGVCNRITEILLIGNTASPAYSLCLAAKEEVSSRPELYPLQLPNDSTLRSKLPA
jgi:hypothetical protein